MKKDHSYGIIPLRLREDKWEILLISHRKGHWWGFPKGHAEAGETPQESASRELKEEVGLDVIQFLPFAPVEEHYVFTQDGQKIDKTVLYFIAEVAGDICIQEDEVSGAEWLSFEEGEKRASFEEGKKICRLTACCL